MSATCRIVRKYFDTSHPDHNKEIATGLTLEEAQEHCSRDDTHEPGVWMDVYYEGRGFTRPTYMQRLFALQTQNPGKYL